MINSIKIAILFSLFIVFSSCQKNPNANNESNETVKKEQFAEANIKKASLNIEGMTCEIGCARTIQSKLSKTNGIKSAKVIFEEKKGMIEYDANKISEKQIVEVVEGIAGGDLYKITDFKIEELQEH